MLIQDFSILFLVSNGSVEIFISYRIPEKLSKESVFISLTFEKQTLQLE